MALVTGSCFGQPVYVEAQDVQPNEFGLFSVAEWPQAGDAHWQMGLEWEPSNRAATQSYACPTCVQNDGNTAPAKTFAATPAPVQAFPFTVIGSFACSPVGNWERGYERAEQVLSNGAERAVEAALAVGAHSASAALTKATAINVGPGTAVTVTQATAILESYIGANGAGRGVILGNRREVTLMASQRVLPKADGTVLKTYLGTPVAALSGFNGRTGPNGVAAGAGEAWLFATGSAPRIWRSDVFRVAPERENSLVLATNDFRVLVEQTYAVGFDYFAAAVLVTSI